MYIHMYLVFCNLILKASGEKEYTRYTTRGAGCVDKKQHYFLLIGSSSEQPPPYTGQEYLRSAERSVNPCLLFIWSKVVADFIHGCDGLLSQLTSTRKHIQLWHDHDNVVTVFCTVLYMYWRFLNSFGWNEHLR